MSVKSKKRSDGRKKSLLGFRSVEKKNRVTGRMPSGMRSVFGYIPTVCRKRDNRNFLPWKRNTFPKTCYVLDEGMFSIQYNRRIHPTVNKGLSLRDITCLVAIPQGQNGCFRSLKTVG